MKFLLAPLLALALVVPTTYAQSEAPPPDVPIFSQPELDQMLAPIALYPDTLLSQLLIAATYPLEVVQAARWSKANPGLSGEQAVRAVDDRDWDPSVKSMVAFPNVLAMMDEKLDWTERLGDAFLAQPSQVMDTVQALRQRAYDAGNLPSSDRYVVQRQERVIIITSPPEVIYVPYYDPYVVYGTWWWPSYRPIFWGPWPGYAFYHGGFYWGVGFFVGHGFFFGHCDWNRRYIRVVDVHPFYYHRVYRPIPPRRIWVHEPEHRRGVAYPHPVVRDNYRRIDTPQQRGRNDIVVPGTRIDGGKPDEVRRSPVRRHDADGAPPTSTTPSQSQPGDAPVSIPEKRDRPPKVIGDGKQNKNPDASIPRNPNQREQGRAPNVDVRDGRRAPDASIPRVPEQRGNRDRAPDVAIPRAPDNSGNRVQRPAPQAGSPPAGPVRVEPAPGRAQPVPPVRAQPAPQQGAEEEQRPRAQIHRRERDEGQPPGRGPGSSGNDNGEMRRR